MVGHVTPCIHYVSYANDFLTPKQMTSAAGTLIFACGLGMIAGPPIASVSIKVFGLNGFLPVMGVIHFLLASMHFGE